MKLGDIKIQALKMMSLNGSEDISIVNLPYIMGIEAYASYMTQMTGAINRCFTDIENRRILPLKSRVIDKGSEACGFLRYDASQIEDYSSIHRVVYSNADGVYNASADYRTEGDVLVLPTIDFGREAYTVLYRPRIRRLTNSYDNESDLKEDFGIPDSVAELIPYFLKSELYREDEPNEAGEARNFYEQAIARLNDGRASMQSKVEDVYVSEAW